jgi:hypothetical protein
LLSASALEFEEVLLYFSVQRVVAITTLHEDKLLGGFIKTLNVLWL